MLNDIQCFLTIISELSTITVNLILIATFFLSLNIFRQLKELKSIEKEIEVLEDEVDNLPNQIKNRIRNSIVNNSQLQKMIAKEKEPLQRKIERLERKKANILDKISILNIFSKS